MRFTFLAPLLLASILVATPASAQLLVPLTTPDGRIACTQGMTGIGRPAAWQARGRSRRPQTAGCWPRPRPTRPTCAFRSASPSRPSLRDLDATLRFKPVSGIRARSAGFMFRAQSANDYYVVQRQRARQLGAPLPHGEGQAAARSAARRSPVESGNWHSLRVIAANDRFEVVARRHVAVQRHRPHA